MIAYPESGGGRAAYVRSLFDAIAGRYDAVNDLMTGGMHRIWKRDVVRLLGVAPGDRVLDLCTGTGDLALRHARAVGLTGQVVAVDFSPEMLARARVRRGAQAIEWQEGDVLALPFEDASFDRVSVGFGLRNVADLPRALAEMLRVLKPGGTAASLDMAKSGLPVLKRVIHAYEFAIVPRLAQMAGAPEEPYRYLPQSNLAFPDRAGLACCFEQAGFARVRAHARGLGAVGIVIGTRP